MTDAVSRSALLKAVENNAAIDDFPGCDEYTSGLRDGKERAIAAINAIAAVRATDRSPEYTKLLNEVVTLRWKCGGQAAEIATRRQPTQSDVRNFLPKMMDDWCAAVAKTWGQGSQTHNVARDGVDIAHAALAKAGGQP